MLSMLMRISQHHPQKNHRKQKGCGIGKEYEDVKRINTKQDLEEEKHPNKVKNDDSWQTWKNCKLIT